MLNDRISRKMGLSMNTDLEQTLIEIKLPTTPRNVMTMAQIPKTLLDVCIRLSSKEIVCSELFGGCEAESLKL